jgi:hypothetical protein
MEHEDFKSWRHEMTFTKTTTPYTSCTGIFPQIWLETGSGRKKMQNQQD